jgi:hypothetical protein
VADDLEMSAAKRWIESARVNINTRQVFGGVKVDRK